MLRVISALVLVVVSNGQSLRALHVHKNVQSFTVCTKAGPSVDATVAISNHKDLYRCKNDKATGNVIGSTDYICYPGNTNKYTCQQSYYFNDGTLTATFKEEITGTDKYDDSRFIFKGLDKWEHKAKDLKEIKYSNNAVNEEVYEFIYDHKGYDFSA